MRTSNNNFSLAKISFLVTLLLIAAGSAAAQAPPLVYSQENTGANCPPATIVPYDQLPSIRPLPDPFLFTDGHRSTDFADWRCRRNEIKQLIEKWDIGPKPDKSGLTINAAYTPGSNGGVLTVDVTRLSNGTTLRITSQVAVPSSGTMPAAGWPAMIELGLTPNTSASGSIAGIGFNHDDITQYAAGQQIAHNGDPYFVMYPEYWAGTQPCPATQTPCTQVGQYSAWSWGVSRLIDGMEIAKNQLANPLPIDLTHLGVHGCSYAGKMALFAGAFDERIAFTHAQENGGGGAPAWRVSHAMEPNGVSERASNTDGSWFITKTLFANSDSYKFPFDHHELVAMVLPRAVVETGNTNYPWLGNRSNYVSAKATRRIFETFGIGDRFAATIDGDHLHCNAPIASVQATVDAFKNRFLLGQAVSTANLDVFAPGTRVLGDFTDPNNFHYIDYQRWTNWWGTGVPDDPRYNLALASTGATALGDTEHASGLYPASSAIDGDTTGNTWGSGTGGWNDNTRNAYPDILEVDFNGLQVIDEIQVVTLQNNHKTAGQPDETTPATGEGILDFVVQTNTTSCSGGGPCTVGTAWVTVPGGSVTGNDKAVRKFILSTSIAATKMRVIVNNARNNWSRIVEVKALGFRAGWPSYPCNPCG